MIVYHVCSYKKLQKYIKNGKILAPVRAWENIEQAERMSISTRRKIILRLKFPEDDGKRQTMVIVDRLVSLMVIHYKVGKSTKTCRF